MYQQTKKLLALVLVAVMVVGVTPVSASTNRARTIVIHTLEGDDITTTRANETRSTNARVGSRLSQGQTVSTGINSFAYLLLDQDSLVKMNQESDLVVESNRNRLVLEIQNGSALVQVETQISGQTTEARAGNSILAVRGTLFVMGHATQYLDGEGQVDVIVLTMLEGLGELNFSEEAEGIMVSAGSVVHIRYEADGVEWDAEQIILQRDGLIVEEMDAFTLQAVLDNQDLLLEIGVITEADLADIPALLVQRLDEIATVQAEAIAVAEALARRAEARQNRQSSPSRGSGSSGGGSGSGGNNDSGGSGGGGNINPPNQPQQPPSNGSGGGGNVTAPNRPLGSGTASDPFLISTNQHLEWMGYYGDDGNGFIRGYFLLMENLTITSPIGFLEYDDHDVWGLDAAGFLFSGVFDGNGRTITLNQTVNQNAVHGTAGLFFGLYEGVAIRNLNINGTVNVGDFYWWACSCAYGGWVTQCYNSVGMRFGNVYGFLENVNIMVNYIGNFSFTTPFIDLALEDMPIDMPLDECCDVYNPSDEAEEYDAYPDEETEIDTDVEENSPEYEEETEDDLYTSKEPETDDYATPEDTDKPDEPTYPSDDSSTDLQGDDTVDTE